jgi:hypothetical protein
VVNETALEAVIDLVNRLGDRIDARKPALDGILNIKWCSRTSRSRALR